MITRFSATGLAAMASMCVLGVVLVGTTPAAEEELTRHVGTTGGGDAHVRVATDFPTLQAAVDDLPEAGGVVLIPANTTIRQPATLTIAGKNNVTLRGQGRTSIIKWEGGAAGPVVRIGSTWFSKIENLRVQGGMQATMGIHVGTLRDPEKGPEEYHGYTHAIELNAVDVADMGRDAEAIRIGNPESEFVSTAAEIKLRNINLRHPGAYGIRIVCPFASGIILDGCYIQQATKAGISWEGKGGGPVTIQCCTFGTNHTDILIEKNRAFTLLEFGSFGGEHSRHLWVKHLPGSHPQITIISSHINAHMPTSPDAITWESEGTLTMIGCPVVEGRVHIKPHKDVKPGQMRFFDVANRYGNRAMISLSPEVAAFSALPQFAWHINQNWVRIGYGNPFGSAELKDIQHAGYNNLYGGFLVSPDTKQLALTGLQGLSSTNKGASNLRGSVTISGTAVSEKVAFERPEPDADYFPVVQVAGISGRPAEGSTRVYATDLRQDGFTVHAEAAPGEGNSVRVCWILVR